MPMTVSSVSDPIFAGSSHGTIIERESSVSIFRVRVCNSGHGMPAMPSRMEGAMLALCRSESPIAAFMDRPGEGTITTVTRISSLEMRNEDRIS